MVLVILGVLIIFLISSFDFHHVSQSAATSSPRMSGPQFNRLQSTGLSCLNHMLQPKPTTITELKDALI